MWEKLRGRKKDWLKDRRSGSKQFFFFLLVQGWVGEFKDDELGMKKRAREFERSKI